MKVLTPDKIKYLIVHCSDTPDNFNELDIHKMHLQFGWDGIGYHKVILKNGKLVSGRPEYWVGAHVRGINEESLGVCLIGKYSFSKHQFRTLKKLLTLWKKKYPSAEVLGHYQSIKTKKTCPNFDVKQWCIENL